MERDRDLALEVVSMNEARWRGGGAGAGGTPSMCQNFANVAVDGRKAVGGGGDILLPRSDRCMRLWALCCRLLIPRGGMLRFTGRITMVAGGGVQRREG